MADISQITNTNASTNLTLDNVQADLSTKIGVYGEDLGNILMAMQNKDILNTQYQLAKDNNLATLTTATQSSMLGMINSLGSGIKNFVIYGIVGIICFFLLRNAGFFKRKRK